MNRLTVQGLQPHPANLVDVIQVRIEAIYKKSDYKGCPSCFKHVEDEVGDAIRCGSDICNDKEVTVERLPIVTLLGDSAGRMYLLDFSPFGFVLTNEEELVGKEIVVRGLKGQKVPIERQDSVGSSEAQRVFVLHMEMVPVSSPQVLDGPFQARLLSCLFDRQPTQDKKLGFNFELLGHVARKEVQSIYSTFSSEWVGLDTYVGRESETGYDFRDSFSGLVETDEYKNTSGNYYVTEYLKGPKAQHYVFGAVKEDHETIDFLNSLGKRYFVLGEQVTQFPLADNGKIQTECVEPCSRLRDDILRRIILADDRRTEFERLVLDDSCRSIARILCGSSPVQVDKIRHDAILGRTTVFRHLKHLGKLVFREKGQPRKRGRPTLLYYASPMLRAWMILNDTNPN
ncbi:MAG: hypothetical protein ABSB53_03765 [Nitrososphaerales archaeon]